MEICILLQNSLCEGYKVSFLPFRPSVSPHIHLIYIEEIDSSLLWQQLSVCCPDLLFARGIVAICWRRLIFSPSLSFKQTEMSVCMCVQIFLHSQLYACSCKLLPFPHWFELRIGSGTCVSQRASGLKSGLAHFLTWSWEEQAASGCSWLVCRRPRTVRGRVWEMIEIKIRLYNKEEVRPWQDG